MALLIFPLGALLGWFIRPPRRAAIVTAVVGAAAFVGMVVLIAAGTAASPLETVVLGIGTPVASWIAFVVARWRMSHQQVGQSPDPGS